MAVTAATVGALVATSGPSSADVSRVRGEAFGYSLAVSLFGGPFNIRGIGQFPCTGTDPGGQPTPAGCAPNPAQSGRLQEGHLPGQTSHNC